MSQIDPELIKKKRQLEQDLSISFLKNDIGAIHSIYFDLTLLQDVYLGALYLHTRNEEEYNKVLHTLPYYQSRIDKDVCKYFPFIDENITDEFLFNFIRNTDKQEILYRASPHTNLWFYIPKLIEILKDHNKVLDGPDGFYCDLYINLYPTNYTNNICKALNRRFKHIHPKISFKTVNMPFDKLPENIRRLPKMYFLEDISMLFSSDSPISKEVYEYNAYDNKFIFSKRVMTVNPDSDIITAFKKTKYFANIFTSFDYVDVFFPGIQYIPPVRSDDTSDKQTVVYKTE